MATTKRKRKTKAKMNTKTVRKTKTKMKTTMMTMTTTTKQNKRGVRNSWKERRGQVLTLLALKAFVLVLPKCLSRGSSIPTPAPSNR